MIDPQGSIVFFAPDRDHVIHVLIEASTAKGGICGASVLPSDEIMTAEPSRLETALAHMYPKPKLCERCLQTSQWRRYQGAPIFPRGGRDE
jgi:hypothetical protein